MKWVSKDQHCEEHCKNKTNACFSCEENDDCNCELVEDDYQTGSDN